MTLLDSRLPTGPGVRLDSVVSTLSEPTAAPFSEVVMEFCADFSRQLSRRATGFPELQALAFWMRRAEIRRLKDAFLELESDRTLLVPAGSVFHVPPANVDTIFIYSWMLSLLCGNSNVVRLSSRSTDQTDLIVGVLDELLEDKRYAPVRDRNVMVGYGHDDEVTRALSAACDVRVIWGGDATVDRIRTSPLAPAARDLTFPDRVSLAAIEAEGIISFDEDALTELATRFYNDSYWFDQLGCSSPRLVVWVGPTDDREVASDRFFAALDRVLESKSEAAETGTAIAKMSFAFGAAVDRHVRRVNHRSNELTVIGLDSPSDVAGEFCGGGAFYSVGVDSLGELRPIIGRRYQTVSHWGFDLETLNEFAREINGMGVDRFVPVGQALTFNRCWDGRDLLQEFTRRVYIEGAP